MSSSVTDSTSDINNASAGDNAAVASPSNKGKGKVPPTDEHIEEEEEEEEEEDEDENGDDEDEDDVEESLDDIDPSVIVSGGRRTRGVRVDYTSKEAHEKAGLKPDDADEDEDDDVEMH